MKERLQRMTTAIGVCGLLALGGCVGAATEGANIARDKVIVSNNIEAAQAGDAEAQYRVGDALCCSLNEGEGFYDTPKAVAWLCRAAAQNHAPAALRLGEIYSGDVVDGVRVLRRVAQKVAGSSTDPAVAYGWMRRAEALGAQDARAAGSALWADMTAAERSRAEAMVLGRTPLPCTWEQVTGRS
jgi:TPR repeat protein